VIEIKHKETGALILRADEGLKQLETLHPVSHWLPLAGADLSGADLRGVDLSGAHLEGARLVGAIYNDDTRWPGGFDPHTHGARLRG
jgi:uncharacterized protein YjbI with pentapeptide repeats